MFSGVQEIQGEILYAPTPSALGQEAILRVSGGVCTREMGNNLSFWRFFPSFTVFLLDNWPFSL